MNRSNVNAIIKAPGKFQDSDIDYSEYAEVAEKMSTNPNHFVLKHKTDSSKNIEVQRRIDVVNKQVTWTGMSGKLSE